MKTALLVIDMQNDYLWEKRKKQFSWTWVPGTNVKPPLEVVVVTCKCFLRKY